MWNKGFTLFETLFVLMIVTIITTVVGIYGYQGHQQLLAKQQVYQLILDIQKIESYSLSASATVELKANSNVYQLVYQKKDKVIQEKKTLNEGSFFQLDKDKKLFFNQGQINQPYTIDVQIKNRVYHVVFQMEYGRVSYSET